MRENKTNNSIYFAVLVGRSMLDGCVLLHCARGDGDQGAVLDLATRITAYERAIQAVTLTNDLLGYVISGLWIGRFDGGKLLSLCPMCDLFAKLLSEGDRVGPEHYHAAQACCGYKRLAQMSETARQRQADEMQAGRRGEA